MRFKPLVDIYRREGLQAGYSSGKLNIGVTGHTYLGKTTEEANDEIFPYYANYWNYVDRQRGMRTRMSRENFEQVASPETALFVGSPEQVVENILHQHELYGLTRFLAQIDIGGVPF
nr:hypothetical protein [Oceanobacillus rekensis]